MEAREAARLAEREADRAKQKQAKTATPHRVRGDSATATKPEEIAGKPNRPWFTGEPEREMK